MLRQNQKRRLERILGVVVVAQHLVADPLHHRPVPLDQRRERRFVSTGHEHVEQLPVGETGNRADLEQHSKVSICNGVMSIGHRSGSPFRLDFPM